MRTASLPLLLVPALVLQAGDPAPLPALEDLLPEVWNAPAARAARTEALLRKARADAAGADWTALAQATPEAAAAVADFIHYGPAFVAAIGGVLLDRYRQWLAQGHPEEVCQDHALLLAARVDDQLDLWWQALQEPAHVW